MGWSYQLASMMRRNFQRIDDIINHLIRRLGSKKKNTEQTKHVLK